jgi:hypothetical protein
VTTLNGAIAVTYTKVESDNRYRKIVDSYTKTDVDNMLVFRTYNFTIPANGNTIRFIYLGTIDCPIASPTKSDLKMEFTSHSYYNDVGNQGQNQDNITILQFKAGSSSGQFQGNGQAYRLGRSNNPSSIRVVQDTNNRYHFYARYNEFSDGSMVSVSYPRRFYFETDEYISTWMDFGSPNTIFIEIPIITIYTTDRQIQISDIPTLSTQLANVYTKSQIDERVTTLNAAIDITYTKVESDNRYRKIIDSYTKTEVDSMVAGGSKSFRLPANGGTGGWYYIGYFITSGVDFTPGGPVDFKADLKLEFVGHSYYNDSNANQDSIVILNFKSGSQTSSGFEGNAQAYKFGKQQYAPEGIRIVQDAKFLV